jgi:hypothetical protein
MNPQSCHRYGTRNPSDQHQRRMEIGPPIVREDSRVAASWSFPPRFPDLGEKRGEAEAAPKGRS